MSMDLAKKTFSTQPDYLIAGNAEIVTAVKEASAALKRGAPVVLNSDGKLAAISVSGSSAPYTVTTTGLYGILAEDVASGEDGIVYLSGEFFADALVLPANATAADVEVPLRNLGIYLKQGGRKNMANEVNIYSPRYLAEVVRQTPAVHTYFRDTFFTNIKTFATERVDIDLVKGDRRMAAFVHPRVGGKVLKANGYQTESYKPPLINPYDVTTADQLMNRLPGEDLYSGMTPAQRAAQKLMEEYATLNDATTRREEWMAVQAIVTGTIPIVGEGVNETIDFGLTNKKTLTGDNKWGGTKADILGNLGDWTDAVLHGGFANVDTLIMGKTAKAKFFADANVQKMLDNRRMNLGEIAPRDLPNGVKYLGHLNDPSLDMYVYGEVYYDDWTNPDAPETKPLIPDNMIILISSRPNYMMAYGACTYIEDASGLWVTSQTSRVLRSYVEHHPDRRMVELQAHPLPIPDKVDSWLVATVC